MRAAQIQRTRNKPCWRSTTNLYTRLGSVNPFLYHIPPEFPKWKRTKSDTWLAAARGGRGLRRSIFALQLPESQNSRDRRNLTSSGKMARQPSNSGAAGGGFLGAKITAIRFNTNDLPGLVPVRQRPANGAARGGPAEHLIEPEIGKTEHRENGRSQEQGCDGNLGKNHCNHRPLEVGRKGIAALTECIGRDSW
jgi:hypothetical protein